MKNADNEIVMPKNFVPIFIALIVGGLSFATAQEPPAPIKPGIQNGWKEIPEWMREDLPFDAQPYYSIPESDNREIPYLEAFLDFDYSSALYFFPGLVDAPSFRADYDAARTRTREYALFVDRNIDKYGTLRIPPSEFDAAQSILAQFEPGFRKLELAQSRPDCFFHVEVDSCGLNTHQDLSRIVTHLLAIRCQVEMSGGNAVRNVRSALELNRDLQRLADQMGQLGLLSSESICFDGMVLPLLEYSELTQPQLDELVSVLIDHYNARKEIDPMIEASRYEYLMWRNLIHLLQSGEYAAQLKRRSTDLGLKQEVTVPQQILLEIARSPWDYQIHSEQLEETISALSDNNPAVDKAARDFREAKDSEAENDESRFPSNDSSDEMLLLPFLANSLSSMTDADYRFETSVIHQRYKQIESACALPYPESTRQLAELLESWTLDDSWKQTTVLKWLQPNSMFQWTRPKSALQTNAYLCLAAVLKWQREHGGLAPDDLADAVQAVGLTEIPVDPFSGEPLKMAVSGSQVVIYSMGPDQDDDRAERLLHRLSGAGNLSAAPDGDIVFELNAPIER